MLSFDLHDNAEMPSAWGPWFAHDYIAYFSVGALDEIVSVKPVTVRANPRWGDKVWTTGPRHIDIYKESYQEHRQMNPLWSFDPKKRNGDFALDAPSGKKIEPWKVYVLYSTEPDLYADEDLFITKKQSLTGGSKGWRHMYFKFLGTKYGMAPRSFRVHRDLARLSFENGHAYWGWRFLSRAGHYLADLGQPFHVKAMPFSFLLRKLFSRRDFLQTVSALHQSYEVYVERRFREGFQPFREAIRQGAKQGWSSGQTVDTQLDRYIKRAQSRQQALFYGLHKHYGPDLLASFASQAKSGELNASSRNSQCLTQALNILFSEDHLSGLAVLDKMTCECLSDVGGMQARLLKEFVKGKR